MRIAINTRFLLSKKMEGFGWYTYEITRRLIENHPEHTFILFFDRAYDPRFVFGPNAIPVVLSPQARHPVLFFLWFEFSVFRALKKHRADLFFSPDGYLSLRSKTPQIAVIHDINFEHFPKDIPFVSRLYLRYFFPRFAKKATKILTVSNHSKQDLVETYHIPESKITAIWNGVSDLYRPFPENEQEIVRKTYAQGKNYFLFVGSLHPRKNVHRLLEAYQLFRKKFPEGYDLLIVGQELWKNSAGSLNISPEFSNNIHFSGHVILDELVKITAAASCSVYVPYFEGFGIPLVEAMKCGLPVIAGNRTSLPEVTGDAALLVDPFSVPEIEAAMEKIFLDPNLRSELSQKSLERSKLFSWNQSAELVWEEILKLE